MTDYDIIVLGLGGIGSAATYWASRRVGPGVLGLEQFPLGHDKGGSEDHSRIIRMSYHTLAYVEMARMAYAAWAEVESDSGVELILRTGGLDLAPRDALIGLDNYRASMTAASVSFEELDAGEVMRRWPQWRLPDDVTGLYQPDAGIAKASIANSTHRRMARQHGARLVEGAEVTSIAEGSGEVRVETTAGSFTAGSLIIAAGGWSNRMVGHLGVELPLEVSLEQVVYLRPRDPSGFTPDRFPIWIWMTVPSFYGFPVFGEPAVKVAWDRCEVITDTDRRAFEPRQDATEAIREFVATYLPDADDGVHLAKTCIYTLTPDRDFILDRVPGTSRVYMAVGAGHAFKFASLIGRSLVDLALDDVTTTDIAAFSAERAVLTERDPIRTYMV